MDITETIAPKSDQQGFDDYLTGPRTVTVSNAYVVEGDQPVVAELVEYPGRPFKPNKSMRRVLAKAWGPDTDAWIGRRLTLFGNPSVVYGGKAVGGVEISHMSHLDKPLTMPLTAKRGQKKSFTVHPLPDAPKPTPAPAEPWRAQWQAITNALTAAGYDGDSKQLLATAGQVIGTAWDHPNKISPEDAQKVLAVVREDGSEETAE